MKACASAHKHTHRHTHCIHIMYAKVQENGMQKSVVCDNHTGIKQLYLELSDRLLDLATLSLNSLKCQWTCQRECLSQNSAVPRSLQSTLLLIST